MKPTPRPPLHRLLATSFALQIVALAAPPFSEFIDPNPNPGNQFGARVVPLSTGNVVITSPYDDAGGTDAGAVYLFNGVTGALISTLKGSTANDRVGSFGVVALGNGNYLVLSPTWDHGAVIDAGAVTWCNGVSGINGTVGSANSLVGSTNGDQVGGGDFSVTLLKNGNYVVRCVTWDNGTGVNAGSVTWGNGANGVSGPVSVSNSLVGSSSSDFLGNGGVKALSNGNYVVNTPAWDHGSIVDAGAVTWGSGTIGVKGAVTSGNSLVGTQFRDEVGNREIMEVGDGNYIVRSPSWDNGPLTDAGAVTWGNGSIGVTGAVAIGNSLIGSSAYDEVGIGAVTVLTNGNYVVGTRGWDLGATTNVGAATWGSGSSGVAGAITSANSLIGSSSNDRVGYSITALSNGNYVVNNFLWKNGILANAGAVTWGSGIGGVSGIVSNSNSLVGTSTNDQIGVGTSLGDGVKALPNGNYVVMSRIWDNGAIVNAGAVTWGNGNGGTVGPVDSSNSLVGTTADDQGSDGVLTVLTNGNYVVRSSNWDNGSVVNAGAVTWGNGSGGTVGSISSMNSLVGTSSSDQIGLSAVVPLTNGNYVVSSRNWDNAAIANAGAVTWGDGASGVFGPVTAMNSLVGSKAYDQVGDVTALPNGNYVVLAGNWDYGSVVDAGAATWGSGTGGIVGPINSGNSLIGTSQGDRVGSGVAILANGNYVVGSPSWNNGSVVDSGAVTWGDGTAGVSGPVTTMNSIYGPSAQDGVGGGVKALNNGHYLVPSTKWDNAPHVDAGAVAWCYGSGGQSGPVGIGNSLVGMASNTALQDVIVDEFNNLFIGRFLNEGGGRVRIGSLTTGLFVVPAVTSVSPSSGVTTGGTGITITGSGFAGVTSILIGGIPVAAFHVTTDSSITATTGARVAGTVDVVVSTPAGSGTGPNLFTYVAPQTLASNAFAAAGLTGNDALPTATPFNDGVENLLKYAFNMNLAGPDARSLPPGTGTSGLPSITTPDNAPPGTLQFEFLRRKGSGLVYTPQKSIVLDGSSWSPLSAAPVIEFIDDDWERVIYTEAPAPVPAPACFGRVSVSIP